MIEDIKTLAKSQLLNLKGETVVLDVDPTKQQPRSQHSHHLPNEIIDQKYKIICLLGEGGMGAVYKAHHLLLNKEVALKTFRSPNLSDDALMRFQREAQAIARLTHQNIVQVFDYGVGEDNRPYYTMECLVGESLADKIEATGPLAVEEAVRIFLQVCDGLSLAHKKGIIHRDSKPANIFLAGERSTASRSATVKIVDFGLAGLATQSLDGQKLTATGTVFGSPLYMSPEQSLGLDVTARSDIYSCGCALFESLTGRPPFHGDNAFATMLLHQLEPAPRLFAEEGGSAFPLRLRALIEGMLAKAEEDRLQSFEEVAAELAAVLQGVGIMRPVSSGVSSAQLDLDRDDPGDDEGSVSHARPRPLMIIGIFGLIGLALFSVAALFNWPNHIKFSWKWTPVWQQPRPASGPVAALSVVPSPYLQSPSPDKPNWRRFVFPPQSLGHLGWAQEIHYDANNKPPLDKSAKGQVFIPPYAQLNLTANETVAANPELLKGFGKYDLALLYLQQADNCTWHDSHMKYISHLTGLREFLIDDADVHDQSVDTLDNLSGLHRLSINFTHLTGPAVSKLKVLPRLTSFHASGIPNISTALSVMAHSQAIEELQLERCDLHDSDMEVIGTMSNLKKLLLSGNPHITNASLQSISKLSHLKELDLSNATVNSDDLKVLRKLGSLKTLHISDDQFTKKQQEEVGHMLSHCNVIRKISPTPKAPPDSKQFLDAIIDTPSK